MWQKAIVILSSTVVGLVIVLTLQWGRPVLIPLASAVLLTFLLNPIVKRLEHYNLNRVSAVLLAVTTIGCLLFGLGWMVTSQVTSMLAELPRNTATIKAKVKSLRQLGSGPLAVQFEQMFEEIQEEIHSSSNATDETTRALEGQDRISTAPPAETPAAQSGSMPWLHLTGYLGSAVEVLGTLAFTLVLLVFFLLERDDLRDRVILLAGKARLSVTSKALEDITDRISRYLLMVGMVNGGFGLLLALGLFFLGMPYAALWGFLAGALRFIPYIGPWIGALFPITMSLALSNGWWQPLAVFGFVMSLELISNNVVEPLLFGRTTGVSPTALLISAAFWLYLWGPIGLMLSAPFAVCLVVIGKNIPQLSFLNLLLGDQPGLAPDVSFYQRLMLGDSHQAISCAVKRIKESPSNDVYDDLLIPTLNYSKRDVQRDHLTEEDLQAMLGSVRESLREINEFRRLAIAAEVGAQADAADDAIVTILGCPASDETDRIALEMLQQLLDPARWDLEIVTLAMLTSELMARIVQEPPAVICIAALPPGGLAHARYLCKRLRAASPQIPIIVGRWGQKRSIKTDKEQLERVGGSFVTTTLMETYKLLEARRPLLTPKPPSQFETEEASRTGERRSDASSYSR